MPNTVYGELHCDPRGTIYEGVITVAQDGTGALGASKTDDTVPLNILGRWNSCRIDYVTQLLVEKQIPYDMTKQEEHFTYLQLFENSANYCYY